MELFKTVGLLRKQIGKLEKLKQLVSTHLQDHQADEDTTETRALMSEEYLRSATPLTTAQMSGGMVGAGSAFSDGHYDRTDTTILSAQAGDGVANGAGSSPAI